MGYNIIGQYTCTLTNNAQELTPYRLEFKCHTSRIRKIFSVCAKTWTQISRRIDGCTSQLCHATAREMNVVLQCSKMRLLSLWGKVLILDRQVLTKPRGNGDSAKELFDVHNNIKNHTGMPTNQFSFVSPFQTVASFFSNKTGKLCNFTALKILIEYQNNSTRQKS
jgi:hypothetical protein